MLVAVSDLVGSPGATRAFQRAIVADDLAWDRDDVVLSAPVEVDLHLDAVVEGVLVRGSVRWVVEVACSRCTEPVALDRADTIAELYADPRKIEPDDDQLDEAYVLVDDCTALDLGVLLRDLILLDVPVRAAHPDGTCEPPSVDGVEIRTEAEDAAIRAATPDPRWAALADLDVPDTN